MTDNVENLLLEHLKSFQASLSRIETDVREVKNRLANLEMGQASIMQHIGHQASINAQEQIGMDRLTERVERIEKRLELAAG